MKNQQIQKPKAGSYYKADFLKQYNNSLFLFSPLLWNIFCLHPCGKIQIQQDWKDFQS